jgi:hypothetical protein
MHSKEQMVCILLFTSTLLITTQVDFLNVVFTGLYRSLIDKMLLLLLQSSLKWGNLFEPWMP